MPACSRCGDSVVGADHPLPGDVAAFLARQGLAPEGHAPSGTPLAGGVSSDIWRIDLPGRRLCVKRALPQLRVGATWFAPVSRNRYEWEWLRLAATIAPGAVPRPLAHDAELGLFAMEFLPPQDYPLWKRQLLDGRIDVSTAARVGELLALLHNAMAGQPDLARRFDSGENFHALRLEPYLLATARRHPDLAPSLQALVQRTADGRVTVVHGDVSPKNILVGPHGPVLLDAECAWYGDPAFDLAFCLNHLLLKAVLLPQHATALLQSFDALAQAYLQVVAFERRAALDARAAALLPALALARIDGKSPVEYLVDRPDLQEAVRALARPLIVQPVTTVAAVGECWRRAAARRDGSQGAPGRVAST
jgi:aminoglycoside phosphotransferase (APT) family kinase protein